MNTAGGNDESDEIDTRRQMPTPPGFPFRDPSVRDVLAQLDRIEEKIDALNARMDADEVARG